MTVYLEKTKLSFKLSETVQTLEEDRVALKMFLQDLSNINTADADLRQLVDMIRVKLASTSKDNRVGKWKDVLAALLADQPSEECKSFVKEMADLLD